MELAAASSGVRRRMWRWYVVFAFIAIVIVGAWLIHRGIAESSQAKENLYSTLFTIRLVEQFVHDYGRWPQSWRELEQMPDPATSTLPLNETLAAARIGGAHSYEWPAQSTQLQDRVTIDFSADSNTIINQDPMQFQAIKPRGPHYEYRDYGFVESLQSTLKDAVARARASEGQSSPINGH
jgi:hypothetical protein